jgi:hypothetical protein
VNLRLYLLVLVSQLRKVLLLVSASVKELLLNSLEINHQLHVLRVLLRCLVVLGWIDALQHSFDQMIPQVPLYSILPRPSHTLISTFMYRARFDGFLDRATYEAVGKSTLLPMHDDLP